MTTLLGHIWFCQDVIIFSKEILKQPWYFWNTRSYVPVVLKKVISKDLQILLKYFLGGEETHYAYYHDRAARQVNTSGNLLMWSWLHPFLLPKQYHIP